VPGSTVASSHRGACHAWRNVRASARICCSGVWSRVSIGAPSASWSNAYRSLSYARRRTYPLPCAASRTRTESWKPSSGRASFSTASSPACVTARQTYDVVPPLNGDPTVIDYCRSRSEINAGSCASHSMLRPPRCCAFCRTKGCTSRAARRSRCCPFSTDSSLIMLTMLNG